MKEQVYVLTHFYYYGKEEEHTKFKMLGIYSSREKATLAIEKYYKLEGFKDYWKECFLIDRFTLGEDEEWTKGFKISPLV